VRGASFDVWIDDGADAAASLAPFAGTPEGTVACMLSLAALHPGETLLDLGAGDGRVMLAALAWGARHVTGWELDAEVCALAEAALAQRGGGAAQARLVCGDCRDAGDDCSNADVVTLFLLPEGIAALTPMVRWPGRMCTVHVRE
jgi:predicted RNA methylase